MSIVVDFAPEVETQLQQEAARRGLTPDAYIRQVVEQLLAADTAPPASLDLLERTRRQQEMVQAMVAAPSSEWGARGQELWESMTPEEQAADDAELAELMNALRGNRRYPGEPVPEKYA